MLLVGPVPIVTSQFLAKIQLTLVKILEHVLTQLIFQASLVHVLHVTLVLNVKWMYHVAQILVQMVQLVLMTNLAGPVTLVLALPVGLGPIVTSLYLAKIQLTLVKILEHVQTQLIS